MLGVLVDLDEGVRVVSNLLLMQLEAVRQLRGHAVNQVAGAQTALVTTGRTGAILTLH